MNERKTIMNRVLWIDLIRVVSAFFVVMIHVCVRVSGGAEENGNSLAWLIAHCGFSSFNLLAVPLFIMISGALLLDRNEEPMTFYRKRFGKILLPFIAWSSIYLLCRLTMGQNLENGTPIRLPVHWGQSSRKALKSADIFGFFTFFSLCTLPLRSSRSLPAMHQRTRCIVFWDFGFLPLPFIRY
jgi:fucose 4-O-acetylase-like acetyltransferase